MIKATAAILTSNSALNIQKCLESIKLFSEIIILDGNSRDSTLNICKNYRCRIIKQPNFIKFKDGKLKNFAEARNILLNKAEYNIILFIDSDEILSKKLLTKIEFLSKSIYGKSSLVQFLVPRIFKFENVLFKRSVIGANYQSRIFVKNKDLKFIKNVHEKAISIKKKRDVVSKKMNLEEFIQYNYLDSLIKIKNKNYYYYKIEKEFIIKKLSFKEIHFIAYRILVNLKLLLIIFIGYFDEGNKKIVNLKIYNIYMQIILSFKLLFNRI